MSTRSRVGPTAPPTGDEPSSSAASSSLPTPTAGRTPFGDITTQDNAPGWKQAGFECRFSTKLSRREFEDKRDKRQYPAERKPIDPITKAHGTKTGFARVSKRAAYVLLVAAVLAGDPGLTEAAALKKAAGKVGSPGYVRSRNRKDWWLRSAKGKDTRALAKNRPGQGPKSPWTDGSRASLKRHLLSTPDGRSKAKKGRFEWNSCGKVSRNPAIQQDLGIPEGKCERTYQKQAKMAGCSYCSRGSTCFLDAGMIKRRIAFAEQYKDKSEKWWEGVAVQDEVRWLRCYALPLAVSQPDMHAWCLSDGTLTGLWCLHATPCSFQGGQDNWVGGPFRCWCDKADPTTVRPQRKVKTDGKRCNFSVLACYGAKAPLYCYDTSLVAGAGPPLSLATHEHLFTKPKPGAAKNTRQPNDPATGFYKLSLEQIKPFLQKNVHIHSVIVDGEKTHPGLGSTCSKAVNWLWRNDPVLKRVALLRGPHLWDAKGVLYSSQQCVTNKRDGTVEPKTGAQGKMNQYEWRVHLAQNKQPGVTHADTWPANSPDLNPAEHLVSAVKLPNDWTEGSYTYAQLQATCIEQYDAYGQDKIDRSMMSMPRRLKAVIKMKGFVLERADYTS